MIDSVINANKKYYPQALLEECKYVQDKIKIESYIDEDLQKNESDSDFNDETESDIDNDKQFVENILILIKSLMVFINHTFLGFYLHQFVRIYGLNSVLLNK